MQYRVAGQWAPQHPEDYRRLQADVAQIVGRLIRKPPQPFTR